MLLKLSTISKSTDYWIVPSIFIYFTRFTSKNFRAARDDSLKIEQYSRAASLPISCPAAWAGPLIFPCHYLNRVGDRSTNSQPVDHAALSSAGYMPHRQAWFLPEIPIQYGLIIKILDMYFD